MPETVITAPAAQPTQQPGAQAPVVEPTPAAGGQAPGAAPSPELQPGAAASTTAPIEPQPQHQQEPTDQGGVQKRISELTRQRREAQRRAEEAEARAAAALEALQRLQTPVAEPEAELQPPVFETPEQFARDMAEHTRKVAERSARLAAQQAREEQVQNAAQEAQRTQQERVRAEFMERTEKVREKHPDFDDVVINNDDLPISVPLAAAIAQHPQGPEVSYYLGTHIDEAKRLATMPPAMQVAELGVIAYKLANPPAAPVSKAAPPIDPVRGPSAAAAPDLGEMSMEEYAAQRRGRR